MKLRYSPSGLLVDHGVTVREIEECFWNRKHSFEKSNSGEEFSFVARTDRGRTLAIDFEIKEKLVHILQLPDREVTMEQEGIFCEIKSIKNISAENSAVVS